MRLNGRKGSIFIKRCTIDFNMFMKLETCPNGQRKMVTKIMYLNLNNYVYYFEVMLTGIVAALLALYTLFSANYLNLPNFETKLVL